MLIEDWYSWRVEEELSVRVSEKLMFSDELSVKINSVTRVPEELRLTGAPPLRLSIRLPSKTENTRGHRIRFNSVGYHNTSQGK